MSTPGKPGQRPCPACGAVYGAEGTRCYPGVPDIIAAQEGDGAGVSAYCAGGFGKLGVPWPTRTQVIGVIRNLRSAGASWDIVHRTLGRFGVRMPEGIQEALRPTTRGQWPPRQPEPTPEGPRPPWRDPRPPLPPGVQDPSEAPGRAYRRPYTDAGHDSEPPHGCAESATGHGSPDLKGNCPWCGKRLRGPQPAPKRITDPTELGEEYRRHYDPDHGSGPRDT